MGLVPVLERMSGETADVYWRPRDPRTLSIELTQLFGVPVDAARKSKAFTAIAESLNSGDIAKAQLIALHMEMPDPLPLSKSAMDRQRVVRALVANGLLKRDWESDEHPRWPAGALNSQGGEFAPKVEPSVTSTNTSDVPSISGTEDFQSFGQFDEPGSPNESGLDAAADSNALEPAVAHEQDNGMFDPVVYRGYFHDQVVNAYLQYLRKMGVRAEKEVGVQMADGSAGTRVDILAQLKGLTVGIEVKTGDDPFLTMPQLLIYPHMFWGESVISSDPKIATFGFKPGQILPPIPVLSLYQQDANSKPVFKEFDPKKMLDEYCRLLRRLRRKP